MPEPRSLHVLIAGGGLTALALAQGIVKSGYHTVEVLERDTDFDRKQGYYLHFNDMGGGALERLLPDDLYRLYLETSRETYERPQSIVLDPQFNEISSRPHFIPTKGGPRAHSGVHRRTLRQILAARLDDRLHTGAQVASFTQDDDGVTVTTTDGRTFHGDVLVGADGIRSAVRSQLLPEVPVIPTGVKGIGVYGRTPVTPQIEELTPDIVNQGVVMAVGPDGSRLLMGVFKPRRPADVAVAEIASDVQLERVPAYVMVSCSVPSGTTVPAAREWTSDTPRELRESMASVVEGWHPAAKALVEGMELDSIFAIPFGFLDPAEWWEPSRVTLMGDAAHAMLPTMGMGANVSLNDSALLHEQLDRVGRGEAELLEAIGAYEAQMREIAYPVLKMSSNHDGYFGGGGLEKAAQGTGPQ